MSLQDSTYEGNTGMTNAENIKAAAGVVFTAGAAVASRTDLIEQWSRIGASWIAIFSGCVVIWFTVSKHYKNKKYEKRKKD